MSQVMTMLASLGNKDDQTSFSTRDGRSKSAHSDRKITTDRRVMDEIELLSAEKRKKVMKDEPSWREKIRKQMEDELNKQVREALETPPLEKLNKRRSIKQNCQRLEEPPDFLQHNEHIYLDLCEKEREFYMHRRWKSVHSRREMQKYLNSLQQSSDVKFVFRDELATSNQDDFPGVFGLENMSEGLRDFNNDNLQPFQIASQRQAEKKFYTKEGFMEALRTGRMPDGSPFMANGGVFVDKYGVIRDKNGPFWPMEWVPLFPTPRFKWCTENLKNEPLSYSIPVVDRQAFDNQKTVYCGKWRGVVVVFDSERSSRDHSPQTVPEGCCPSLQFESRFESGNLRQARRVGQFEYELVLKTDLYTAKHTQWYYFRVQNTVPGIIYKFRIVNLLKRNSLYNYGMRPLLYSEHEANTKQQGWIRTGHHISYSRNILNLHCPLLSRGVPYYMLEFQMDFPHANDTCYLAHCYPYTYTDLKEDLDNLIADQSRQHCIKREVMCESRAGNSCFLLTVTNFENPKEDQKRKKGVVITARVHPGESQASWMMKGVLDFITSSDPAAKELRNSTIFKIVPMLNPDGVIVGNYRCSLAARDLNRNYRHPRRETFPTVSHTKAMIESFMQKHEVILYCDLHGHSRKPNVFMYGNNTSTDDDCQDVAGAKSFINERLFPWLMAKKAPDKFSFPSCKFCIRKCKEATGRVVMWRQMRILNSFTLETTFSGTSIDKSKSRHFNILDLQDIGKMLCQVVQDYQQTKENKTSQTEAVMDITKFVTHQILRSRGITTNVKVPEIRALMKSEGSDTERSAHSLESLPSSRSELKENAGSLQDMLLQLVSKEKKSSSANVEINKEHKEKKKGKHKKASPLQETEAVSSKKNDSLSQKDVETLLDSLSSKTMDGCLEIISRLNVRNALPESDSSDSDSESESEMREHSKSKKKKKKSHKQRDKEVQDRKSDKKSRDDEKHKLLSINSLPFQSLPSIGHEVGDGLYNRKQYSTTAQFEKYMRLAKHPQFVSKYEGRSNGGIPCFAEERSIERAAKRMADMKKRNSEDRQGSLAFYSSRTEDYDDSFFTFNKTTNSLPNLIRRSITLDDFHKSLQVALQDGTADIAQTLAAYDVKTSYTHGDFYGEIQQTSNSANAVYSDTKDQSDSETEEEYEMQGTTVIPITARNTPYQLEHLSKTLQSGNPINQTQPVLRKNSRAGLHLGSVSRHLANSSTGFSGNSLTSSLLPKRANSIPNGDQYASRHDEKKVENTPGSFIKNFKIPDINPSPYIKQPLTDS